MLFTFLYFEHMTLYVPHIIWYTVSHFMRLHVIGLQIKVFKCYCDVAVNVMSSGKFCHCEFFQLIPPLLDFCSVRNFDLMVLKSIATKQVLE